MYLGIDLGTSEVKALVIDENHEVIASHSAPLSIQRPHPHWSEQAPELWWEATEYLMATLRENAPSIGRPLRRLASPGRCTARCCWMQRGRRSVRPFCGTTPLRRRVRRAGGDGAGAASGGRQPAMPGFTAPKLLWVRRHEPEHFQRTATVLLPKDYLRYRMTGKKVSDMSDAAGTLWLDVAKRDWSDALLDKCGLSRSQMPTLVEGCEVSATLDPQVAARWGLNASVMVAGGGG